MRKEDSGKEKQVNITGRTIWVALLIVNVIFILIKLFNVFYFKRSFVEEFDYTYFMSLFPTFFLFMMTANVERK